MDYHAVLVAGAQGLLAPRGYNGTDARVDLAQPSTHVLKSNRLVYTAARQVDLAASWAYAIYAAQGFPENSTAVTAGHMESAGSRLKDVGVIHAVMAFMAHVTLEGRPMVPDIRTDDGLSAAEADALFGEHGAGYLCMAAANALWAHLDSDGAARSKFYADSKMGIMLLCMNQMHRELCEFHQWYTNAAVDPKTQTGRCTAMAGASKEDFMAFVAVKNRGHDMWHFLGNTTMRNIVYAIIGKPDGALEVPVAFQYMGEEVPVGAIVVADYLKVSDSVKDRLPSGTIGVAGLIVGVQYVAQMLEILGAKSRVEGGASTLIATNSIKEFLSANTIPRAGLLRLKAAFLPMVATAVGFKSFTAMGRDEVESYEGLTSFVKQDIKNHGRGKMLAEAFEKIQVTPDKLAEMVRAMHMEAREAFEAAVALGADPVPMAPLGDVVVEKTPDQKREERAEREELARAGRGL